MSLKTLGLPDELHTYLVAHGSPPDEVLRSLADETRERLGEQAIMQIAPEQGGFMTLLARLVKPRLAVEIGTFTGYSSICIARGLPGDGRLVCFDQSEEWTAVARRYWDRAGLSGRIELRLGDAAEMLDSLDADPPVDFAFIDADKAGYPGYYERILSRLSPDGLIVVDNVLASGAVVAESKSEHAAAIAAFNDLVAADERVDVVMLPVADGLSLITRAAAAA